MLTITNLVLSNVETHNNSSKDVDLPAHFMDPLLDPKSHKNVKKFNYYVKSLLLLPLGVTDQ